MTRTNMSSGSDGSSFLSDAEKQMRPIHEYVPEFLTHSGLKVFFTRARKCRLHLSSCICKRSAIGLGIALQQGRSEGRQLNSWDASSDSRRNPRTERDCSRRVMTAVSIRSTNWLPTTESVPKLTFRQITAGRIKRSA